jgi:hypothetical protein
MRHKGIIRGAMTRHIAAFDQVRLLVGQFEYLWLENEFYKARLKVLGVNETDLQTDLQTYQVENKNRAEAAFATLRRGLDELAQALLLEESERQTPPTGQTN